jgi:hypothetical protein
MGGDGPFRFAWPVDQDGYEIAHVTLEQPRGLGMEREYDLVRGKGGPLRFYRPLEDDGLWLRFAQTCKDADSVLSFANEFGRLGTSPGELHDRVDEILGTAALLRRIWEQLQAGERLAATKLFASSALPTMKEGILWYADRPEVFEFRLVPQTLRDALLHQTGEAITGKRRFRQCRNEACPNWFRLGPQAKTEEGRRTYTARREFCSDGCRVAWARRAKREG